MEISDGCGDGGRVCCLRASCVPDAGCWLLRAGDGFSKTAEPFEALLALLTLGFSAFTAFTSVVLFRKWTISSMRHSLEQDREFEYRFPPSGCACRHAGSSRSPNLMRKEPQSSQLQLIEA